MDSYTQRNTATHGVTFTENDAKEAFALRDRGGTGKVPVGELDYLVRCLGGNPTNSDLDRVKKTLPKEISFEDFMDVCGRERDSLCRPPGDEDQYLRAFRIFDKEQSGFIGVGHLKYILTTLGEPMNESEVNELLDGFGVDGDQLNYHEFIKYLLPA